MPKNSVYISAALGILKEYNYRITIRALFYRLVGKGIIENNLWRYQTLCDMMATARRDGRIPYEAFEDHHRRVEGLDYYSEYLHKDKSPENILNNAKFVYENAHDIALRQLKHCADDVSLPFWYNQPNYVEVWIEKDALVGVFLPITESYHVALVINRGYASLSMLYDAAQRFREIPEDKKITILYFGDYDVRGINIQESIEKSFEDDFDVNAEVIRVALTKEQINAYQLPPSPAKLKDSMIKGWIESHGNVAWELDAIEPHTLEGIIQQAIEQQIDDDIRTERSETIQSKQDWINKEVTEYLAKKEG